MTRLFFILSIICMTMLTGCIKTAVNGSDPIVFTTDASASNISVASSFQFKVTITSRIGYSGLSVAVTAVEEVSGLSVLPQPPSFKTNITDNSTSVINLPRQKWVVTTIKVTDLYNANNTASKTFRVIYK
ncbi:hypothetical protein ACFOW1_11160 [Parasediminibacterium paludis]|uniref:Uncharacterized protein n=1 Tax=Parasediminibacterium paludis TaxID=908966 RepID=A0ABV8PZM5_9BACT